MTPHTWGYDEVEVEKAIAVLSHYDVRWVQVEKKPTGGFDRKMATSLSKDPILEIVFLKLVKKKEITFEKRNLMM